MELRHIRYFQVLAEELNFSRAAERLHIAQPPLSRQIQELEEEIGVKLFFRTKRQVELTNAGKAFLQKSYEILELVDQASINARLSSTGTQGEFKIGFTGTIQDMIPTIATYRELYPNVEISLSQMTNSEQIHALNENNIDLAVISVPIEHENIEVFPVKTMKFVLALPEKHPLVRKASLSFKDLENETFIMTPKSAGSFYYDTVMNKFNSSGIIPNVKIKAHDLQTVLLLVAGGLGIALTPSSINSLSGVVHREIDDFNQSIVGSIAWRKDNQSEILHKFLAFFENFYQKDLGLSELKK